jgi:hypothetical protein
LRSRAVRPEPRSEASIGEASIGEASIGEASIGEASIGEIGGRAIGRTNGKPSRRRGPGSRANGGRAAEENVSGLFSPAAGG